MEVCRTDETRIHGDRPVIRSFLGMQTTSKHPPSLGSQQFEVYLGSDYDYFPLFLFTASYCYPIWDTAST